MTHDVWAVGDAYEAYVGRWSRRVAEAFVRWLDAPAGWRWVDVGCGTGALTAAVLAQADPAEVIGVDPSDGFLARARDRITDARVAFHVGDARSLPVPDGGVDAVVSGLAVNFVPEPDRAAADMVRALRPGGLAAAYVWDYAEGMRMMRIFWDAATMLDPAARAYDAASRFPMCRPEPLRALWSEAGCREVSTRRLAVTTRFQDFDEFWRPFLGGQGPAPSYFASLDPESKTTLTAEVHRRVPIAGDASVTLEAVAWEVRGLC